MTFKFHFGSGNYLDFFDNNLALAGKTIIIIDHLNGFSKNLHNDILDQLLKNNFNQTFLVQYIINQELKKNYQELDVKFSADLQNWLLKQLLDYKNNPEIKFQNFICSFNGSLHVSRMFLTAALKSRNWFNPMYSTKNIVYTADKLYGNISEYGDINNYQTYFANDFDFFNTIFSFNYERFNHSQNIYTLEGHLTQSFLHLVSETMATSYYPFVTEKFLYSVVTRGLFLSYAQPNWHEHVEKYYGFKKYNKIFDYTFDTIKNPVDRLICLLDMVNKYSTLTSFDWHDLYLIEKDTIDYNYDHYFSQDYLKRLKQCEKSL